MKSFIDSLSSMSFLFEITNSSASSPGEESDEAQIKQDESLRAFEALDREPYALSAIQSRVLHHRPDRVVRDVRNPRCQ